ncbi:MAG: AAA family ATPase, partial [Solirubrobacterales bacterium]
MHLKSLTVKGFKSFPDRTKLLLSPGVSVVVGPNGSGKSNVTDAILWALGEQRPLAVRGQTMQDVIFAGGRGQAPRQSAEVELVLDNSDGEADVEFSEIAISRRLDRSGEGEYRLNGARCRLADVLEVLSDTGLGKEMHSVISQGRVEQIVLSKPGERRLLVEEAAGLGKHRKRRRRAELKLGRTRENLDRALDVEREARSQLRPLKRQAEAADLHARLERQRVEARAELVADELRALDAQLRDAETELGASRSKRDELRTTLAGVTERRRAVEQQFAERDRVRRQAAERLGAVRGAADRTAVRQEALERAARELREGAEDRHRALESLEAEEQAEPTGTDRVAELEAAVSEARAEQQRRTEAELEGLSQQLADNEARAAELREAVPQLREAVDAAERELHRLKGERKRARRAAEEATDAHAAADRDRERHEARIAALARPEAAGGRLVLAGGLTAEPGLELALTAALGERLRAALVDDVSDGLSALAAAQGHAVRALLRGAEPATPRSAPCPGATRLLDHVDAEPEVVDVAARLLSDAWLVDNLDSVPRDFGGIAVTREGWAWDGRSGELRSLPEAAAAGELSLRRRGEGLEAAVAERAVVRDTAATA